MSILNAAKPFAEGCVIFLHDSSAQALLFIHLSDQHSPPPPPPPPNISCDLWWNL